MKRRAVKRQGHALRRALSKAHTTLAAERYELGLSRRAVTALNQRNEHERSRARSVQADLADEVERLRRYAREAAAMVGHQSMLVGPPEYWAMPFWAKDDYEVTQPSSVRQRWPLGGPGMFDPTSRQEYRHSMMMRALRLDVLRDRISDMTHVKVSVRGQCAGYAISDAAIDEAPREVLASRIAEAIADLLVSQLRADPRGPYPPKRWRSI